MQIDKIKNLFTKTDEKGFPKENCTKPNSQEKNIFDGEDFYLCLIVDAKSPGYYEILQLQPYIFIDDKNNENFGWTDKYGNIVDNMYKSIHIDDRCVIGCIIDDTDSNKQKEEWKQYAEILKRQWE